MRGVKWRYAADGGNGNERKEGRTMSGCYDCKYWAIHGSHDIADELNAECRRYPPDTDNNRPTTNGLCVCGEWIHRQTGQDFLGRQISNNY